MYGTVITAKSTLLVKSIVFFQTIAVVHPCFAPHAAMALQNLDLIVYLFKELAATKASQLATLRGFYPDAKAEDWTMVPRGAHKEWAGCLGPLSSVQVVLIVFRVFL